MKTNDLMYMGIRNLWRRKLRTSLTIVGVVIGTFSIIVMVSLGIGMNESFKSQIMEMGSLTTITVNKYYQSPEGQRTEDGKKVLDDKTIQEIKAIPHVSSVSPVLRVSGKLVSGKYISHIQLTGIDPTAAADFDFPPVQEGGKTLDENSKNEILFGSGSMWFYNPKKQNQGYDPENPPVDVLKDKMEFTLDVRYGDKYQEDGNATKTPAAMYKVKGAGIMEESQGERDWNAYINIHTLKEYIKEYKKSQGSKGDYYFDTSDGYHEIWVKVDNVKYVEEVQDAIKAMKLGANSLGDMLKPMQKTANTLQLILGGIGAVSMLVSAIGIANTMIMSIYERTKEIGVMKVLGCLVGDIQKLFLFEATMIGFMGGLFGVAMSFGASYLINTYGASLFSNFIGGGAESKISVIPIWLILLGLGFAVLVGMISGYYPAKRATKISALEAMKSEG